jgi:hypothetical protein
MDVSHILPALERARDLAALLSEHATTSHDVLLEATYWESMTAQDLLRALRDEPSFEPFDGRLVMWGSSGFRVELEWLARWLLRRARRVGSQQALADVVRYLESESLPGVKVVCLSGLKLLERGELAPGIEVVPWEQLDDQYKHRGVEQMLWGPFRFPTSALLKAVVFPKRHLRNEETPLWSQPDETDLDDLILCMGIIGPTGPTVVGTWMTPQDWMPVTDSTYSMPWQEGMSRIRDWPQDGLARVRALFKARQALPEVRKVELRIPARRLISAIRRVSPEDSAIDLGIALEALFLGELEDDRGELSFRLKVRAARLLRKNSEERLSMSRDLTDLYTLRSRAVHSGKLPNVLRKQDVQEIFARGFRIVSDALELAISSGLPDWDQVVFGA